MIIVWYNFVLSSVSCWRVDAMESGVIWKSGRKTLEEKVFREWEAQRMECLLYTA